MKKYYSCSSIIKYGAYEFFIETFFDIYAAS